VSETEDAYTALSFVFDGVDLDGGTFVVRVRGCAAVFEMSLMPTDHFFGMRRDVIEQLKVIAPTSMRFPGGCAAHGNGLDNMYLWKRSIGKLEERQHMPNIWNYHQTLGLGYYEYFIFCEDIGAEPLPVIPAAVPC
jgi:alpha-L-arabinofuranosidase